MNIQITKDPRCKINQRLIKAAVVSILNSNDIRNNLNLEIVISYKSGHHEFKKANTFKTLLDLLPLKFEDLNNQNLQILPKVGLIPSSNMYPLIGKIIISYNQAVDDAALDGKTVDHEIALICEQGIKYFLK